MTIAVRSIYYKAVTPSFRILYLNDELWGQWLFGSNRKHIEIYKRRHYCPLKNGRVKN